MNATLSGRDDRVLSGLEYGDDEAGRAILARFDLVARAGLAAVLQTYDVDATTIPLAATSTATLLDAVHASSNAPVLYFDAPTSVGQDGAQQRY